jgi:hypothetical protein
MSILRGRIVPLFLAVGAGTAFALTPATPALAATWSVVPTPNASNGLNLFAGVDALSTTDAWAVGRADHSPQQPFIRPLAARWNGSTWTIVNTPTLSGQFSGVDGSASNNVWAVGVGSSGSLTERWNGTSWSVVPSPSPPNSLGTSLSGVKTFSSTNAWAVGSFSTSTATGRSTCRRCRT